MTVTSQRQYSQLRIYIDDTLHIHLPLYELICFQSWIDGEKEYYIEYIFKNNIKMLSTYSDRGLWEQILKILSDKANVL